MPKNQGFEWTDERTIKFIREYRLRTVLWNPKDPWFNQRTYRQNGWSSLAQVFNTSPIICKKKLKSLQRIFRKEKKKRNRKWPMFPHMKFLLEISKRPKKPVKPKRRDAEDDSDKESSETDVDSEPVTIKLENDTDVVTDEESTCSNQPLSSNPPAKTLSDNPNQPRESVDQPGPSQAQTESIPKEQSKINEEIDAFMKFVNTKMKKYSMSTVNEVQRQIFEILFRTDQTLQAPAANPGTTQVIIADARGSNIYAVAPTTQVSNIMVLN